MATTSMKEQQQQQHSSTMRVPMQDQISASFSLEEDFDLDVENEQPLVQISLDTPFSARGLGDKPKSLDELLVAMQESWQSEETAQLTYMLTSSSSSDDDTVDSRILAHKRLEKQRLEKEDKAGKSGKKDTRTRHESTLPPPRHHHHHHQRRGGKRPVHSATAVAAPAPPVAVQ